MNKFKTLFLVSSIAAIAGCASQPDYGCDIPEACAPVNENYQLALQDENPTGWVSEGANPNLPPGVKPIEKEEPPVNSSRKEEGGFWSGLFGSDEDENKIEIVPIMGGETDVYGGAVFVPPRPHRIWLGHWKGRSGELNSGNYTYLTTPGYYNYQGERYLALPYNVSSNGAAQGPTGLSEATLSPVRPDQLGFRPKESKQPSGVLDDMVQPSQEN
jgi:hypothetical protein